MKTPQPGDVVGLRLRGMATLIVGIFAESADPVGLAAGDRADVCTAPGGVRPDAAEVTRLRGELETAFGCKQVWPGGVTVRFPAELRASTLFGKSPLTGAPTLQTVPYFFFAPWPVETFAADEVASCRVLVEDDFESAFAYGRSILADYRQTVKQWTAPSTTHEFPLGTRKDGR